MCVSRACFVATLLCLGVAVAQGDTLNASMPKDELAEGVLRLLTDPDGYPWGHSFRHKRQGEVRYGLTALGDDASVLLVEALGSYEVATRFNAARLLRDFGDGGARDALRKAYLAEPHIGVRRVMAAAMQQLSADTVPGMLVESLGATAAKNIHDDRIRGLLRLEDARALPYVQGFAYTEEAPGVDAALAALHLVEAGDRDAIPLLVKHYEAAPPGEPPSTVWSPARVVTALRGVDAESAIPAAARALQDSRDPVAAWRARGPLSADLVPDLLGRPTSGEARDPDALYRALREIHWGPGTSGRRGTPPSGEHVDIYGEFFLDPTSAAEPGSPSSSDGRLRQLLAEILASLGEEGRDYLRQGVRIPHCHREALGGLASYYDMPALQRIAGLAADLGYAHRDAALSELAKISEWRQEAAEPLWLALAADDSIDAVTAYAFYTLQHPSPHAQALLATLLDVSSPDVRTRAGNVRERLQVRGWNPGPPPEGLQIQIATDRPSYRYNAPATLTVEFTNTGDTRIPLDAFVFDSPDLFDGARRESELYSIELVQPDGSRRTCPQLRWGSSHINWPRGGRTLEPAARITTQTDMRRYCRPAQPGLYRARLTYGSEPDVVPVVRSNWVEFVVEPPPAEQVDRLVSRLDTDGMKRSDIARITRISFMLGELRDPRAIDALRAVALLPMRLPVIGSTREMAGLAARALAKFDTQELVPMWIELLHGERRLPPEQLAKLGDKRAMAPLRANALNDGNMAAVTALVALGDDSVLRFLRSDPLHNMDPSDESTWRKSETLALLLPTEDLSDRLGHEHPAVRGAVVSAASQERRVDILASAVEDADVRIRWRAVAVLARWKHAPDYPTEGDAERVNALRAALDDPEADIRRGAARGLARVGDGSGEAILLEDLTARDYKTRVAARPALTSLHRRQ